jgi:peptidoglycan hydrolase-like protein with peptidoglycan-binding domain
MTASSPEETPSARRERRARRAPTSNAVKAAAIACAVVLGAGLAVTIGAVAGKAVGSDASAAPVRQAVRTPTSTTTAAPPSTTTTTLPALRQPSLWTLPAFSGTLGPGSDREVVRAYQHRLVDLHFDPGAEDGTYSTATQYAVQTVQKIYGFPVTGRLGGQEAFALAAFQYPAPLQPTGEGNRTEIDVAKQVLTLYRDHQVRLITTTSTGSGEHYCYNSPRVNPTRHICEVATTPSGRFTYTRWVKGWDKSPLGQLYQPYYFNGGIAVHGYTDVPTRPASHGCARIPMHIAQYYPLLVHVGDPVYVFGGQPAQILSSNAI